MKNQRAYNNFNRVINRLDKTYYPILVSSWALLTLIVIPSLGLAQNVFNGTWKVDPGSYSSTVQVTFTLMNGVYRVQSTGQPAYQVKADGKFHKVTGQPGFDAESVRIIDDHTVETTREKNGKKFRKATFSVNPDGKTGTFSFRSVNNGHTFKGKSILKRVA
ncbi:MAG TPA: hypothetical protein VJ964_05200, partial [Balneolaceae bacterium]|nr:hypothetical protein [Balneolaceae bacterium]